MHRRLEAVVNAEHRFDSRPGRVRRARSLLRAWSLLRTSSLLRVAPCAVVVCWFVASETVAQESPVGPAPLPPPATSPAGPAPASGYAPAPSIEPAQPAPAAYAPAPAAPAPAPAAAPPPASATAVAPVAPLPPSAASEHEYVPATQTQVYEEAPPPPAAEKSGPHCLLGALCLGPVLTAGAIDVFGVGVQARTDFWGIGFDYQFVNFTARGVPVRLSLLTVEGRIYPFGGAFFVAGGLAWQAGSFRSHLTYPGNGQIPPIETDISGSVNVPVFKIGTGFMGRNGFVMGIDLSLGLRLAGTRVSFTSDLPRIQEVIDAEDKIRNRANTWIRGLPFLFQVNLLRFAFLF